MCFLALAKKKFPSAPYVFCKTLLHAAKGMRILGYQKKTNELQKKLLRTLLNEPVDRRLINVEEAAQYLGIKAATVYKKTCLRNIPFVKIGHALRFDVKALDCHIEQSTIEAIDWKENARVY